MDLRAGNPAAGDHLRQRWPMGGRLGQRHDCRRFEPGIDLAEGAGQWRGPACNISGPVR